MYITGCIFLGTAWAASVYVKELGHGKAEVMINGSEARPMWVGETTPEGVRLHSVADDAALFEIDGKLWTLKPDREPTRRQRCEPIRMANSF